MKASEIGLYGAEKLQFGNGSEIVSNVFCAANCTLAITPSGKLYMMGTLCDQVTFNNFTIVSSGIDPMIVKQVYSDCWAESVMIQCDDGSVYMWGVNISSQFNTFVEK
jgi:alpha-tubulin suppressor-like RCC1 family protein